MSDGGTGRGGAGAVGTIRLLFSCLNIVRQ